MELRGIILQAITEDDLTTFKKYPIDSYMDTIIGAELVRYNRLSFIEYLYDKGYLRGGYIEIACRYGNYEIFLFFVKKGLLYTYNTLDRAVENGNMDILLYLRDNGILNKYKDHSYAKYIIARASKNGRLDIVKLLVEEGYPIANNTIGLIKSFKRNNNEILRYLHDKGVTYDWCCPNCIHCNAAKKEKIQDEWYMENEDYNSIIQWLPKEMIEDTMILI